VKPELVRDADRANGWWLLVENSEQSFVDTADAAHLEFEYVQMIAYVLETLLPAGQLLDAVHLGGGLLTIPRWIALRYPGSRQLVAERSGTIARMAASLGDVPGVEVRVQDALAVIDEVATGSADVVVCDVYDGPETVTSLFTLPVMSAVRDRLRADGLYVCNLSDASPFALSQVVVATIRAVFREVVLLAEPPVLRGRRSGNLVVVGTDRTMPVARLTRRASAGPVRARVLAGERLAEFVGTALPAGEDGDLPESGESRRRLAW